MVQTAYDQDTGSNLRESVYCLLIKKNVKFFKLKNKVLVKNPPVIDALGMQKWKHKTAHGNKNDCTTLTHCVAWRGLHGPVTSINAHIANRLLLICIFPFDLMTIFMTKKKRKELQGTEILLVFRLLCSNLKSDIW